MTLGLLRNAPRPILSHAILAFAAPTPGAWQIAAPKGTRRHRLVRRRWVAMMACVAASGLSNQSPQVFGIRSPSHVLSVLMPASPADGIAMAGWGEIAAHRPTLSLLWLALVVTGTLVVRPGRVM